MNFPAAFHPEIQQQPHSDARQHHRQRLVIDRSQTIISNCVSKIFLRVATGGVRHVSDQRAGQIDDSVPCVQKPQTVFFLFAVKIKRVSITAQRQEYISTEYMSESNKTWNVALVCDRRRLHGVRPCGARFICLSEGHNRYLIVIENYVHRSPYGVGRKNESVVVKVQNEIGFGGLNDSVSRDDVPLIFLLPYYSKPQREAFAEALPERSFQRRVRAIVNDDYFAHEIRDENQRLQATD
jgi:hypothetical protein